MAYKIINVERYFSESLKNIDARLKSIEADLFGSKIDKITPRDTGDMIDSKHTSVNRLGFYLNMDISYNVEYAVYVHDFVPIINWTNPVSEYQFLSTYMHKNKNLIVQELNK